MKASKRMLKYRNFLIYWKKKENSQEMDLVISFSLNYFMKLVSAIFLYFTKRKLFKNGG